LDIGVLGYIGIVQHKKHSPEVLSIPPGTSCTHIHMICCSITETYNRVTNFLTYNFSKEQCMLPEDDLRIETCSIVLNVLV